LIGSLQNARCRQSDRKNKEENKRFQRGHERRQDIPKINK